MRCTATTQRGRLCRKQALAGSELCIVHQPRLAPEQVEQLLRMLRTGNYLEVAALATGLTVAQLAGQPALRARLAQAQAEGEVLAVARIAQAAQEGNWQATAWLLERQHPERWGRPAVRAAEEITPPLLEPAPDGLDELAGRRAARRGRP